MVKRGGYNAPPLLKVKPTHRARRMSVWGGEDEAKVTSSNWEAMRGCFTPPHQKGVTGGKKKKDKRYMILTKYRLNNK